MFKIENIDAQNKDEFYKQLLNIYLLSLISDETDWLACISNTSALLYLMLSDINWAGFYLYKGGELVLGPFQGKTACVRIPLGKGVCGTAAKERKIQVIKDVNEFSGHIACDAASKFEIVLPIVKDDRLIGVLDIDSPVKARFDNRDTEGLSNFTNISNEHIIWPEQFI